MVIYDEARLRHEQRMYAATETYAIHHRRLLGVVLAIPAASALVLLSFLGTWTWLDPPRAILLFVASVGLSALAYAAGRVLLRRLVARRYGVVDVDAGARGR